MPVTVQLTYEMSKAAGAARIEVEGVRTVADAVRATRERLGLEEASFAKLTRVTALAVNGVLTHYQRGLRTPLTDGDTLSFVKAAAGG